MPKPLSLTEIDSIPPFSIVTVISVEDASIEFSINSLTIFKGRSTTSPAAILLINSVSIFVIF